MGDLKKRFEINPDTFKDVKIVGELRTKPFTFFMPKDGLKPGLLSNLDYLPCPTGKSNMVLNVLMDAYRKGQVEPKVIVDAEGERTVWVTKEKP